MSSETNERLVREGIEAFNRGDLAVVNAFLDQDVESRVGPGLANTGIWRGVDGFVEMITTWGESFAEQRNTIISIEHPDEHHAIAEIHQAATGAGSGVPVEMTIFYMYEIRDEKAVRFHIYADRDEALAATG